MPYLGTLPSQQVHVATSLEAPENSLCMYVYMYVCMYVFVCLFVYTWD
jgi:hypothetical protein